MALFIEHPWLAALAAIAFMAVYVAVRRRVAWMAALGWAAYGVHEELMRRGGLYAELYTVALID